MLVAHLLVHKAPLFLRSNPHIHTGYRAYLDTGACFKSLCVLSNEWVNVWSHLAGALFAVAVLTYDNAVFFPAAEAAHPARGASDRLVISFFLLCTLVRSDSMYLSSSGERTRQAVT